MSKKTITCPKCFGHKRIVKMCMGKVVDSYPCIQCKSTGRVPKPRKK